MGLYAALKTIKPNGLGAVGGAGKRFGGDCKRNACGVYVNHNVRSTPTYSIKQLAYIVALQAGGSVAVCTARRRCRALMNFVPCRRRQRRRPAHVVIIMWSKLRLSCRSGCGEVKLRAWRALRATQVDDNLIWRVCVLECMYVCVCVSTSVKCNCNFSNRRRVRRVKCARCRSISFRIFRPTYETPRSAA